MPFKLKIKVHGGFESVLIGFHRFHFTSSLKIENYPPFNSYVNVKFVKSRDFGFGPH